MQVLQPQAQLAQQQVQLAQERDRSTRLAATLRELSIDPDEFNYLNLSRVVAK